jgi:hypothetical protein
MIYSYHTVTTSHAGPKTISAPVFGPPPAAFAAAIGKLALATASLDPKRIGSVQAALDTAAGLLPGYIANYRNLNLVIFGLRTADALPVQAAAAKSALAAASQAGGSQAAPSALAPLSSALIGFTQLADTAMQTLPAPAP